MLFWVGVNGDGGYSVEMTEGFFYLGILSYHLLKLHSINHSNTMEELINAFVVGNHWLHSSNDEISAHTKTILPKTFLAFRW